MPLHVEAYTVTGIVTGTLTRPGHLREILEASPDFVVEDATWRPLDGSPPASGSDRQIAVDDLMLAASDEDRPGPVHAAWHTLRLEAGPYGIEGELPTLPGFDPGRALTRPTGTFVLLREVRISLLDDPGAGENGHPVALVNRYAVDKVDAELMLGFFFPGAHVDMTPSEVAAAAIAAPPTAEDAVAAAAPETAASEPAGPTIERAANSTRQAARTAASAPAAGRPTATA